MARLRLTGLMLFVTTVFLALAAAATQTKEIRFTLPQGSQPLLGKPRPESPTDTGGNTPPMSVEPPPSTDGSWDPTQPVEFFYVPIAWPLAISGGSGLLLWFGTAPRGSVKSARRRRRRRRK